MYVDISHFSFICIHVRLQWLILYSDLLPINLIKFKQYFVYAPVLLIANSYFTHIVI